MKKYLPYFYFLLLFAFTFCSQNEREIKIEVIADNVPEGSSIYITGNDDQLGNWQPNEVELNETEKGKWSKSFSFTKGKKLEFKFTRGSWQNEALNDDGSTPVNYTINVSSDTSITYNIKLWADQVERKVEGQITGTVKYHRNFWGEGIKPRDVIVWLPPGYESDLNKNYPVLYMHDGQNIVDPNTSSFQVDWQIDEAADSLIRKELIEPIIIVGIYNTPDRNHEYSEDKLGLLYMKFIVDSLKPFIDRNYRTKPDRMNTANGGGSLGGLISFMLMWDYSEIFSKAICFSPAFKIDQYDFVDNVKSYKGKSKSFKLYILNGDNELDSMLQPGVDEMLNALKHQGYFEESNYYFQKGKNSLHGEKDWAKNIWRALIFLFGTEKGRHLL
jgi:predicted alpha/beta superfamily hydrolase